jgi:hypothetical protein
LGIIRILSSPCHLRDFFSIRCTLARFFCSISRDSELADGTLLGVKDQRRVFYGSCVCVCPPHCPSQFLPPMYDVVPLLCEIVAWHNLAPDALLGVILRSARDLQHAGDSPGENIRWRVFSAHDLREMADAGSDTPALFSRFCVSCLSPDINRKRVHKRRVNKRKRSENLRGPPRKTRGTDQPNKKFRRAHIHYVAGAQTPKDRQVMQNM